MHVRIFRDARADPLPTMGRAKRARAEKDAISTTTLESLARACPAVTDPLDAVTVFLGTTHSIETEYKHCLALQVLLAVELTPHHLARALLARLLAFAGFTVAEASRAGAFLRF